MTSSRPDASNARSSDAAEPAVLTIAGSDPSGGAGQEADLKTFQALGAHGMSALTLATDCTTRGVEDIEVLPPAFVTRQIERVARDIAPAACKTGLLYDEAVIEAVTGAVDRLGLGPLVVDPVLTTRDGTPFLSAGATDAMRRLVGRARVATPSRPEAGVLVERTIRSREDVEAAARAIQRSFGPEHVVVTGGREEADTAADFWLAGDGTKTWLEAGREPVDIYGAGDAFSAALVVGIARGASVEAAVGRAKAYVTAAIRRAPPRGRGPRPLAHG
jgi:hydroxymethylpyrimidine/phosphomethylpyrimidine kinase